MVGMFKAIVTEEKRIEEISMVMDVIESLCTKYGIKLIAKERKGKNIVVIQDSLNDNKEYVMIRSDNQWK